MWMVHEIFYAMFDIKESGFCWGINVTTDQHGDIMKIILSLDSNVHDSTNPVFEGSSLGSLIFKDLLQ